MNSFWDFWYGLPNERYLDFVRRAVLQTNDEVALDPFMIDLPAPLATQTFLPRDRCMASIRRTGTHLIMGEAGIGKRSIMSALLREIDKQVLPVGIPLPALVAGASEADVLAGRSSVLTLESLIPCIFDSYWETTIRGEERSRRLPQLRADRRWMELLRWFYHRCPPCHPESEDYELMSWLGHPPRQPGYLHPESSSTQVLRELVQLVTWQIPPELFYGNREVVPPYSRVEILVGGTWQLSSSAAEQLLKDTEMLHALGLEKLCVKLFIDSNWQEFVVGMDCIREGRMSVISLPPWSEQELRKMLRRRLLMFQPGGVSTDPEEMPEYNLGDRLRVAGCVVAATRNEIEGIIISHAQGNPARALRLARYVVAACAGCGPAGFTPPFKTERIRELVDLPEALR